ncbi:hypothetical protein EDB85DRAFT_1259770 [Lactarius pseudohatsudake]|nr:hypothetical protein EDB85DRAFT_1259770 [Lactarius pseudohatsudake]
MPIDALDLAEYYLQHELTVYNNLFVGIVYGIYIVLYATSVHILLGKPGFTWSRPKMVMFATTTFMFVLGIVALVLGTALEFQKMWLLLDQTATNVWPLGRISAVIIVTETIRRLMFILSDIICAWRAVVLWNRDKRVIALLLLFIIGTTAAVGCEIGLFVVPAFGLPSDNFRFPVSTNISLLLAVPILGTNLVSTGLIAWKAWQHRVSVRKHLGEGTGSVRVNRVFALLIDSGFVYCCLWILYLISAFDVIPYPGATVIDNVLMFVSGLYPTLIVTLVAMQKSPVEHYSTYSTGIQFATGPAFAQPSARSIPSYVYTICREHTNDSDEPISSAVFIKTSDEEKNL